MIGARALAAYRNKIATALVEQPELSRSKIFAALLPRSNAREESRIDVALSQMVERGELERPWHGVYRIKKEPT